VGVFSFESNSDPTDVTGGAGVAVFAGEESLGLGAIAAEVVEVGGKEGEGFAGTAAGAMGFAGKAGGGLVTIAAEGPGTDGKEGGDFFGATGASVFDDEEGFCDPADTGGCGTAGDASGFSTGKGEFTAGVAITGRVGTVSPDAETGSLAVLVC
jgi:hypothetical protein